MRQNWVKMIPRDDMVEKGKEGQCGLSRGMPQTNLANFLLEKKVLGPAAPTGIKVEQDKGAKEDEEDKVEERRPVLIQLRDTGWKGGGGRENGQLQTQ